MYVYVIGNAMCVCVCDRECDVCVRVYVIGNAICACVCVCHRECDI